MLAIGGLLSLRKAFYFFTVVFFLFLHIFPFLRLFLFLLDVLYECPRVKIGC
jgi:hypothetical protein